MDAMREVEINESTYQWSVRSFSILKKMLSVNIKMHHQEGQIESGEIFLFNHFARFETFIPQYLIYEKNGDYCRSIASAEFFEGDDTLTNYLLGVGAVPNNYPNLIPYMAREILRGRKVIIFPEGGMVKDRRSMDDQGHYSIYSRTARERRKHHTGAAVLSLAVDLLKKSITQAFERNQTTRIRRWMQLMKFEQEQQLRESALRPSSIVPANITFYPMRVGDNLLNKSVELFNRGISKRLSEELLIEGNILLKHTDMDIRLGDIILTEQYWSWWTKPIIKRLTSRVETLAELINTEPDTLSLEHRFLLSRIRKNALRLRNSYMRTMYHQVTINLSHLAAQVIYELLENDARKVDTLHFCQTLYLTIKKTQEISGIHLHRSLKNPEFYYRLIHGECKGLDQFFQTAAQLGLIELKHRQYQFSPKLCEEHSFDQIRTENIVEVYANEIQPVARVKKIIPGAVKQGHELDSKTTALYQFDDEVKSYQWDKWYFNKPRHEEVNAKETATKSGEPFFFLPEAPSPIGIVLSHGFLASPAEIEAFGERLRDHGYAVIAPRLKGHATSPWDLRERSWQDWLLSVERSYEIMQPFCERICMIGFSTGGALSLLHASAQPDSLLATIAISAPLKFVDKNMLFVPLVHHANRLMSWLPSYEGIMPFRPNESENPDINYHSIPVHALFELRQMVSELNDKLVSIHCPVHLYHADRDPVVEPISANMILDKISSDEKSIKLINSDKHGILYNNTENIQQLIIDQLDQFQAEMQHAQ